MMKRMKALFIACSLTILGLLFCSVSSLSAQSSGTPATGQIKGVVMDVQEGRVADAIIQIVGQDFKWEGRTNGEGEFTADVPTATYHIYVKVAGFRKFESPSLKVNPNVIELINIHLDIAPVSGPVKVEPQQPN